MMVVVLKLLVLMLLGRVPALGTRVTRRVVVPATRRVVRVEHVARHAPPAAYDARRHVTSFVRQHVLFHITLQHVQNTY